jgi:hypothetical protein
MSRAVVMRGPESESLNHKFVAGQPSEAKIGEPQKRLKDLKEAGHRKNSDHTSGVMAEVHKIAFQVAALRVQTAMTSRRRLTTAKSHATAR